MPQQISNGVKKKISFSPKHTYTFILLGVLRNFPSFFIQRYVWFLIAFLFLLAGWWGWIFYTKAYTITTQELEEAPVRVHAFPYEELGRIEDEIERREELFSNTSFEKPPDPFRD